MSVATINCEQAYGRLTFGQDPIFTAYFEVKSGTKASCTYYLKVENLQYSDTISQTQRTYYDQLVKGKDMTCTKAAPSKISVASNLVVEVFPNDVIVSSCTGPLKDAATSSTS
jgi:hypothetical protein